MSTLPNPNKSSIIDLHNRIITAYNRREQAKADSLRQKPGYDSIGQNQTILTGLSEKKGR